MRAVDRLKRDHKVLRSKLEVLEAALRMGPETWFVLREVCCTLSRQLRDHIRREEELAGACRNALTEEERARTKVEHQDEPEQLRKINRLFASERGHSFQDVQRALSELIPRLRAHMDEEETGLFPTFERMLADQDQAAAGKAATTPGLHEQMTVNRVLQQCPETRPVFEQLFINPSFEGHDCLDEVAWRHGMVGKELLEQLEDCCVGRVAAPQ